MIVPWSSSGTRPVLVVSISMTSATRASPSVDHISHLCLMKSSTPCLYLLTIVPNVVLNALRKRAAKLSRICAVLVDVGFQEQGTERRRERKGVDGRDTDGHGHRDTELGVEDARRSAHHGHGNEDGHEDQRRGDDGRCDARHGVDGGHGRKTCIPRRIAPAPPRRR